MLFHKARDAGIDILVQFPHLRLVVIVLSWFYFVVSRTWNLLLLDVKQIHLQTLQILENLLNFYSWIIMFYPWDIEFCYKFSFSFVQYRSISGEDISLFILSGKYIAIALVDHYKLRYVLYTQFLTNPIPLNYLSCIQLMLQLFSSSFMQSVLGRGCLSFRLL